MKPRPAAVLRLAALVALTSTTGAFAQLAVRGKTVHTMAGAAITDGIVVVTDGKITAVGPADQVKVPDGYQTLQAEVVTPGLIDAHTVVGLSGIYNHKHDQDQLERSAPIQPELRALDAYNAREKLVGWVRSFGVTTIHTGHAPGELISGQTLIVKTTGNTVEQALLVDPAAVAATLGKAALKKEKGKTPGTRGKQMSLLRQEFIKAREYVKKRETAEADKKPERNLRHEIIARLLAGEMPLMVTCQKVQDIASALRLAEEFDLKLILDGAAESYLLIDKIKAAGVPVIVHPSMIRAWGEAENMSFETAAKLHAAGIPIAIQSGFESYVPKTRVVLFEAGIAAANGLSFDDALASITISPARILGIDNRVGSLEVGKDADLALYDGDPFEYTTHCMATLINGQVVHRGKR